MLVDLKKELLKKERVIFTKKKMEFKYSSATNLEIISDIISDKMMKIVKKNFC